MRIFIVLLLLTMPVLAAENSRMIVQADPSIAKDIQSGMARENISIGRIQKGSFTVQASPEVLEVLENDPRVRSIRPDRNLSIQLDVSTPLINSTIARNLSFNGTKINGSGTSVCVIDTGVNADHQDLAGTVVAQYCYCDDATPGDGTGCCPDGSEEQANASDDNGHGTHVAGIVASRNATYTGVAPGASIVAVKALDSAGNGRESDIAAAVDWCVANASTYNISVISMSLGDGSEINTASSCDGFTLSDAIDAASAAGILVTAASGNDGHTAGIAYPACATNAMSVGASTDADAMAGFTNYGSILDILAPGAGIISTDYDGTVVSESGTSMATPHVAAVAALLFSYAQQVENRVPSIAAIHAALTTTPINISAGANIFPRLDAYAALLATDLLAPSLVNISPVNGSSVTGLLSISINTSEQVTATISGNNLSTNLSDSTGTLPLPDGNSSITLRMTDLAGNTANATLLYVGNNSPPNITVANTSTIINETENVTFNVSATDDQNESITFSWEVNGSVESTNDSFIFYTNYSSAGTYNITITAADSFESTQYSWNISVANTNREPNATISLQSNVTTNETINCTYEFSDPDNDTENGTRIQWIVDGVENASYENMSVIPTNATAKGQSWTCVVTPSDGTDTGNATNATIPVINAPPSILNVSNSSVLETRTAIVNISVLDADNDTINVSINDTRMSINNTQLLFATNLSSAGTYTIAFNASDGNETTSGTAQIIVINARDADGDGNPDFNDTDDDNDGIPDELDKVLGSSSSINSSETVNVSINGSTNFSNLTGNRTVTITAGNRTLVNFSVNFENETVDLYNVSVNATAGKLLVKGVKRQKSVHISTNTSLGYLCVLDAEVDSWSVISSLCNATNETLLSCPGSSGNYTCTAEGDGYRVTGLQHSAISEQCGDADGDGYNASGCGGNDCNDASSSVSPGATEICGNGIDDDCSGGDAACSTGGGGGGGGAPQPAPQLSPTPLAATLTSFTSFRFSIGEQPYTVRADTITKDAAVLAFFPGDRHTVHLKEKTNINLDGDGEPDVAVTATSLTDISASILLEIPTIEEQPEKQQVIRKVQQANTTLAPPTNKTTVAENITNTTTEKAPIMAEIPNDNKRTIWPYFIPLLLFLHIPYTFYRARVWLRESREVIQKEANHADKAKLEQYKKEMETLQRHMRHANYFKVWQALRQQRSLPVNEHEDQDKR